MTDLAKPITNQWWINARQHIVLFAIACASLWLLLANLGNQYLWEDEAQTALVSKTILTDGVPRGYDGKNFFSQEGGAEYGKNYIWRWHTWLPFYVLAGFYKLFGVSTFVSRLPFALFGFATIVATYFLARAFWPGTRVPIIAAALLAVSVPFLLLCRQCRYYSMTMCFTVLSLYAYAAVLNGKKYAAVMLVVVSTLLFHSQHFYIPVLYAAMLLHAAIFRRDRLKLLLIVVAALTVVNGPWMVWLSSINYPKDYKARMLDFHMMVKCMWFFLRTIFRFMFPVWLLIFAVVAKVGRRFKKGRFDSPVPLPWEKILLPVFFVTFNVLFIVVAAPQAYSRYIAPSMPLLIILVAVIIDAAARVHFMIAAAMVVLLLATSQLKDFLYEITHDYTGPIKSIVRYLNEHGSPDDVVAISYGDLPLKFYTNMRVIGGLTGEDLEPAKNARWVIMRARNPRMRVAIFLNQSIDWGKYIKTTLGCPDTVWENREDPWLHRFQSPIYGESVVICERKTKDEGL